MDSRSPNAKLVGRGAGISPPNRFERVHAEDDWEHLDPAEAGEHRRRDHAVHVRIVVDRHLDLGLGLPGRDQGRRAPGALVRGRAELREGREGRRMP